jgi:O-antigen ligase
VSPEPRPGLRPGSVLFALVLLSPLLWLPGYGYDGPRLPLVLVLAALLLGIRAFTGTSRRGPAPLLWAALILFGVHVLSLAVAHSPGEAAPPILVLFCGVAVFAVARGGTVSREFVLEAVPILLSIVGLSLAAIGVVQETMGLKVTSTEGNTNYAGALAGMLFPPLVAFSAAGKRRLLSFIAAASLFALLLLTRSRGGWFGAVGGTAVAIGALAWRRVPGARIAAAAGLLLVVLPLALEGRGQLSESRASGVTVRLELWKGSLRMIAAHPFLGVGAGNFAVEYPPYRSEAEFRASHQYVDSGFVEAEDAHSSWAQAAVETGAPGLLSLLLVAYVAARLWRHHVKTAAEPGTVAFLAGVGGGAAAFLLAGLFNTLTLHVSHTVLFWAFLGMIELAGRQAGGRPVPSGVALPLAVSLAAAFGALGSGSLAYADWAFNKGMHTSDPESRETWMLKALTGNPGSARAWHEIGRARTVMGRHREAAEADREAVRLRPHDVAALDQLALSILRSKGDENEAERHLRHAIDVAPYYFLSHFNLGLLLLQQEKVAAAREQFALSSGCNEKHVPSVFSMGETWALEGNVPEALAHFRRARSAGMDVGAVFRSEHPGLAADPRYAELFK